MLKSAARRTLKEGGAYVNNEKVLGEDAEGKIARRQAKGTRTVALLSGGNIDLS